MAEFDNLTHQQHQSSNKHCKIFANHLKPAKIMINKQIARIACIASSGLIIVSGLSANAQTVIYSDTFAGSAQNLDGAPTTGIGGVNGTGSGAQPQSSAVEQTIDGSGNLQLVTPATSGGDSGYIRFGTIGSTSTLYDWAASPGAAAIASAGGMIISFNWTAADTTAGNWIFIEAGASLASQTSGGYGYSSPIFNSGNSGGVFIKNNGGVGAFNNGVQQTSGPGFTPTSVNHVVTLDYSFNSFASGTPVSLTAIVDGTTVQTDSFTWQNSYNYLNIGTYQENGNLISNLQITTVPEPTTLAMMAGGFGLLFAVRRFRQSRA